MISKGKPKENRSFEVPLVLGQTQVCLREPRSYQELFKGALEGSSLRLIYSQTFVAQYNVWTHKTRARAPKKLPGQQEEGVPFDFSAFFFFRLHHRCPFDGFGLVGTTRVPLF